LQNIKVTILCSSLKGLVVFGDLEYMPSPNGVEFEQGELQLLCSLWRRVGAVGRNGAKMGKILRWIESNVDESDRQIADVQLGDPEEVDFRWNSSARHVGRLIVAKPLFEQGAKLAAEQDTCLQAPGILGPELAIGNLAVPFALLPAGTNADILAEVSDFIAAQDLPEVRLQEIGYRIRL
jgi:hypothetical protein